MGGSHMHRSCRLALGCGAWWLLISISLFAQSIQSSLTGIVTDPQGAVVVEAQVVATEVGTGVQHQTATNSNGLYSFQDLPPSTYVVRATKSGFKEIKSDNIIVVASAMQRFDAKLEIGAATEVMVVKGTPPTLVTDSAEIGDLQVGEDAVREPIQRSTFQLVGLTAGNVANGSGIAIGGQRIPYQ